MGEVLAMEGWVVVSFLVVDIQLGWVGGGILVVVVD